MLFEYGKVKGYPLLYDPQAIIDSVGFKVLF